MSAPCCLDTCHSQYLKNSTDVRITLATPALQGTDTNDRSLECWKVKEERLKHGLYPGTEIRVDRTGGPGPQIGKCGSQRRSMWKQKVMV